MRHAHLSKKHVHFMPKVDWPQRLEWETRKHVVNNRQEAVDIYRRELATQWAHNLDRGAQFDYSYAQFAHSNAQIAHCKIQVDQPKAKAQDAFVGHKNIFIEHSYCYVPFEYADQRQEN